MMPVLDKSRDYGTVLGDDQGRCYIQDGIYFNACGEAIGGNTTIATETPTPATDAVVARPRTVRRKPAETDQLSAQMEI